jgi:hypothetical protein
LNKNNRLIAILEEIIVEIITGATIAEGDNEPYCASSPIMENGMSWMLDVLITINSIISNVITSFSSDNDCRSFMAFIPSGVAALPTPNRFARKFRVMDVIDG